MEVQKQEKTEKQVIQPEQQNGNVQQEKQIRSEIMRIVQGVMRDFKKDLDYLKDR